MSDRLLSFLGICKKAGKLYMGFDLAVENIEKGKAKIILIASDLSEKTRRKIISRCTIHNIDYIEINSSIEDIYDCLGKGSGIISILDLNCSEKIRSLLKINSLGGNN